MLQTLYHWLLRKRTNTRTLNKAELDLMTRIREKNLTYCGPPKLENLAEAIRLVSERGVPGLFLEAGVALGGSAILIARLKPCERELHLYDVFSMIPPPGKNDGDDAHTRYAVIQNRHSEGLGGKTYYGYVHNLLGVVKNNFRDLDVSEDDDRVIFHIGLFQDTLYPDGPVAFAHVDGDWYDSVKTCLDRISPFLSPGGIIVFDDYSSYSGCRKAVDEFLSDNSDFKVLFHRRSLAIQREVG